MNCRYQALKESKVGSDKFVDRYAQTINAPLKDKSCITDTVPTREVGCSAEGFVIADEYAERSIGTDTDLLLDAPPSEGPALNKGGSAQSSDEELKDGQEGGAAVLDLSGAAPMPKNASSLERSVAETVLVALSSEGCLLNTDEAKNQFGLSRTGAAPTIEAWPTSSAPDANQGAQEEEKKAGSNNAVDESAAASADAILFRQQAKRIMTSDSLIANLKVAERAVIQNRFHKEQLRYRNTPAGDEALSGSTSGEKLQTAEMGAFGATASSNAMMDSKGMDSPLGKEPSSPLNTGNGDSGNIGEQQDGNPNAAPVSPGAQSTGSFKEGEAAEEADKQFAEGDKQATSSDATIVPLFKFKCQATEGRTVTSQVLKNAKQKEAMNEGKREK